MLPELAKSSCARPPSTSRAHIILGSHFRARIWAWEYRFLRSGAGRTSTDRRVFCIDWIECLNVVLGQCSSRAHGVPVTLCNFMLLCLTVLVPRYSTSHDTALPETDWAAGMALSRVCVRVFTRHWKLLARKAQNCGNSGPWNTWKTMKTMKQAAGKHIIQETCGDQSSPRNGDDMGVTKR